MKLYYIILFFICLTVKPAYKLGYVAYFELNIDYIVEKYCVNKDKPVMKCNGKCHLSKKLSFIQTDESITNEKRIANSIIEAFLPVYFEKAQVLNFGTQFLVFKKHQWNFKTKDYLVSLSITSPPPQV